MPFLSQISKKQSKTPSPKVFSAITISRSILILFLKKIKDDTHLFLQGQNQGQNFMDWSMRQKSPWRGTFQRCYFFQAKSKKASPQKGYTAKRLHPKNGIIWHGLIHAPKGSMDLFWRGTFQRSYFLQAKSKKATSQKGYYYQKASKFLEIGQYIRGYSLLAFFWCSLFGLKPSWI